MQCRSGVHTVRRLQRRPAGQEAARRFPAIAAELPGGRAGGARGLSPRRAGATELGARMRFGGKLARAARAVTAARTATKCKSEVRLLPDRVRRVDPLHWRADGRRPHKTAVRDRSPVPVAAEWSGGGGAAVPSTTPDAVFPTAARGRPSVRYYAAKAGAVAGRVGAVADQPVVRQRLGHLRGELQGAPARYKTPSMSSARADCILATVLAFSMRSLMLSAVAANSSRTPSVRSMHRDTVDCETPYRASRHRCDAPCFFDSRYMSS